MIQDAACALNADTARRLFAKPQQVGAGVYDGISTVLAQKTAFDFLWLSSFSTSAALGLPDVGLLDVSDVASLVAVARRLTRIPIVVDMESGYGDAVRTFYAAGSLASAGATAVCIEDNSVSRRSSLYEGYSRTLADPAEQCAKIAAACDATAKFNTIVVARTEALVAGLEVDEALRRSEAYVAAGAHAVFVQCVAADGLRELLAFCERWDRRTPVFIAPTKYEHIALSVFYSSGVSHYIYANQALRAAHRAIEDVYRRLMATGPDRGIAHELPLSRITEISMDVGEDAVRVIPLSVAPTTMHRAQASLHSSVGG